MNQSSSADQLVEKTVACTHCQLPVPAGLIQQGQSQQFCCQGCSTAYEVIHGCGLENYYAMRERIGGDSQAAGDSGSNYEEFDDAGFQSQYVVNDEAIASVTLYLQGVHCAACVWLLEKTPSILEGVIESRVNLTRSTVTVRWLPEVVQLSEIGLAFERLGYPAHPFSSQGRSAADLKQNRKEWARIAVAGACAGNTMLIAIALYAGMFSTMANEHQQLFRYASAAIGLVCLVWPGSVFFAGAFSALKTRTPHMDLPVALGLGVGGTVGLYNTVTGSGEIYFDSLCMLIFFLLIGRHLQLSQQRSAADRVSLMRSIIPRSAFLVEGDTLRKVLAETLKRGDIVEVRASELIPADGIIIQGKSSIDQSLLTGESEPVAIDLGDSVTAGATNLTGTIRITVTATGEMSRIGRIMQLVETATVAKSPVVQLADRIGGYFVVTVIFLSILTAAIWWSTGIENAINHSVALLIVACPCALGLATPLALAVAQGQAARNSILIKQADRLERLAKPGTIWLDKTGTITQPGLSVVSFHSFAKIPPTLLRDLHAIESQVVHPVSRAILNYVVQQDESLAHSSVDAKVTYEQGSGVNGVVDSQNYLIGTKQFVTKNIGWNSALQQQETILLASNQSPVYIAKGDEIMACLGLKNAIRSEVPALLKKLNQLGWTTGILSGDHQKIVEQIAEEIGVPLSLARGGLSPEKKLEQIQKSLGEKTVVMIGDGVNDGAALAAADVGVAVQGGAEVSLQAADIYLGQDGLRTLSQLLSGAKRTLSLIYKNFIVSLLYNVAAVILAMTGIITPLMAAILMPISSLSVISFSLSSRLFEVES